MTTPEEEARLAAEGWIKHDGKGMPVDGGTMVDVRIEDDTITHYRVHAPAQAEPTPVPADTLTIRDQIALDAPIPITVAHEWYCKWRDETDNAIDFMGYWAERRYAYADAMLAERAKK